METVYIAIPQIKVLAWVHTCAILAVLFAWYFINSLFTYRLSKSENASYPFLAWVPVLRPYNYFEMSRGATFDFFGIISFDKRTVSVLYIVGGTAVALSSQVSLVLFLLFGAMYLAVRVAMYSRLYHTLSLDNAELFAAISTLAPPVGIMAACISYEVGKRKRYGGRLGRRA